MKLKSLILISALAAIAGAQPNPVVRPDVAFAKLNEATMQQTINGMDAEERRQFQEALRQIRCNGIKPQLFTLGVRDTFGGGADAVSPSPQLQKTFPNLLQVAFDQAPQEGKYFATSMRLGACKVCGMIVQTKLRRAANRAQNDAFHLGVASGVPGQQWPFIHSSLNLWQNEPPQRTEKVVTVVVPVAGLNQAIFNLANPPAPFFLDFILQDDTSIDYIRVWRW